jgi:hypothetical protein
MQIRKLKPSPYPPVIHTVEWYNGAISKTKPRNAFCMDISYYRDTLQAWKKRESKRERDQSRRRHQEQMFNEDDVYVDLLLCYFLYAMSSPNTFSQANFQRRRLRWSPSLSIVSSQHILKAFSQCKCFMTTSTLISFSVIYPMHCLLSTHFSNLFPREQMFNDDVYVDLHPCYFSMPYGFRQEDCGYLVRWMEPIDYHRRTLLSLPSGSIIYVATLCSEVHMMPYSCVEPLCMSETLKIIVLGFSAGLYKDSLIL